MKKEEKPVVGKIPPKNRAEQSTKEQEATERAAELPGKQASVAAEMKNREH
jgi:hypothetical protein